MINHLTNQHGKDSKSGVKLTNLKKILALLTSNQTQSLTLQTICQLLKAKVTTSSLVLVLPFMMLLQMQPKNNEDVNYVSLTMLLKTKRTLRVSCLPIMKVLTLQVSQQQCNQKQIKLVSLVVKHQIQLHVLKLVSQQVLNL